MFLPGENGQIFNHGEMMGLAKRAADNRGPSVTTEGSGNQTTFHITLNVDATSREAFQKLLDQNLLDKVYS